MTLSAPFPFDSPFAQEIIDPVTRKKTYLVTEEAASYFQEQQSRLDKGAALSGSTAITGQTASIGATAIPVLPAITTGYYRVSYSARITTAASTSSSLTVTVGWTENSIALSQAGSAMTGNATTTQQNGTLVVLADNASPITYLTTYASSGGTAMQYRLTMIIEAIPT